MKQKLRILTLSFLLVMQSFFGLAPITLAEGSGGDVVEEVVDDDEIENEAEETEVGEKGTDSDEGEQADFEGNEEEATEEDESELDEESADEGTEEEETSSLMGPMGFGLMAIPSAGVMPPEDVMTSTEFTVGGQPVVGTSPVTVQNGQTAQFKFNLELAAGHSYGPGTTMTYSLPDIFTNITFPQGTKFGDLGEITKNGNEITITFGENIHDGFNGTDFEPGAHFYIAATFNNTGNNVNETISLPGQANIALNFTPLNGKSITKNNGIAYVNNGGNPIPSNNNSDYIAWTVTVNTDLKASGTVEFKDTLSGGHTFDTSSVTITELTMKPDGTVLNSNDVTGNYFPNFNGSNTEMTIDLNGTEAYEITYHTIPDDPGNNESVTYRNSAQYGTANAETKNATVGYGTPLSKEYSGPNTNLETTWTIKYNFNKRTISEANAILTDSWSTTGGSGTGTQVMSDFNVYEEDGTTPVPASEYTMTENGEGFTLQFNQDVTEPYVIKYKTTPNDFFATSNFTVENTVTRSDIGITRNPSVTYNKTTFMLTKSAGNVNYANKTIPWTISANQAGYSLNAGTTFTDTFTNQNMTLKEETLVVKVGSTELTKGLGYTLVNNGKVGFNITLTNTTNERIVITYTTDYDIKDVGMNTRQFENKVAINNSGLPAVPSDSATRTVATEQTANGKKDGKYNYATKKFEWSVELNFNYNTLQDAIFEDVLPSTQTIDVDSIEVYEGTLNEAGVFQPGNKVSVTNTATEPNKIKFSLGPITGPYKVTYTSHDTDGVYPETTGKVKIINNATLKDGTTQNASWTKTVGVNYTDKLITKNGSQIGGTAGIKWNFQFNYAQSNLKNIVITDTVGKDKDGNPNQLIKPDSFKVYQVALSGKSDNVNYNAPKQNTLLSDNEYDLDVNIQAGTFELKLPDGISAYYIEYETIYIGDNNSTLENAVQVNYVSNDGNQASTNFSINNFRYGNAGTTYKVPFVVVKTDGATGEPMADVEFTLYSDFQLGVALISKKTNANGVFDLGMKLTEGNYTLKETTVAGYDNPGDISFKLSRDSVAASGPHAGKQIVEVENFKTGANVCPAFTLTVKDVDRNVVASKNVTLTNQATGHKHTGATNINGEMTLNSTTVKAGTYTVTINEGGTEVTLGEVTVTYSGNCQYELQPLPKCNVFTIAIEDKDNVTRPNVNVTLKHKTDSTAPEISAKTDASGQFTVPSTTTQTGEYKVYEGNQYLGDVTITYKNVPCEAVVTELPTCETFTLIVKDVDGKPREAGVSITIKDKDGNVIETLTTDSDGKVKTTKPLLAGEYGVFEGSSTEPFVEFTTNTQCEAGVQPEPACPDFTITVNDENGNPRKNVTATVKNQAGNEITAKTTDNNGNITVPSKDLPAGTYDIFEGGIFLGKVEVSYKGNCGAGVDTTVPNAGTCPNFTLTIQDSAGNPRSAVQVTIQDANGNEVEDANGNKTFTTDQDGKIKLGNIKPGKYDVYEGSKKIGSFTADNTCGSTVKPAPIIPPVATCANFTVTVKQGSTSVGANVLLTLKSSTTEVTVTTDSTGKIVIDKNGLPEGSYTAYDKDGKEVGTITVHYQNNCNATIQLGGTDLKITLEADPETIVADGKSQSTLTAKVTDEDGKPVEGVTVVFEAGKGSFPNGNTAVTDENGNASVILKSEKIEDIKTHEIPVKATVHDTEKGLYAEDRMTMIFEPSSITGVVKDNKTGEPIEGVKVVVTKTFEDGTTFHGEAVTGADGKYKIPIPRGDEQYDVEITKTIIVNGEPEEVTFKQKAEAGEITSDKNDEEFPAEETFTGVVIMKDKNGKDKIVRKDFGEKIVIKQIVSEGTGKQSEINSSGVFTVEGLEKGKPYEFAVIVEVDGKEVIMGKIKVTLDSDGEIRIHEELIDPYGTITDSETGEVIGGAHVELYFADTPRNRGKGRTPDTLVNLPILPGFAPNDNKNPQTSVSIPVWSDEAGDHGNYAWMVFPEGDYYIVAKKPGYKDYISPTISVEYDIVKHDFEMEPIPSSDDDTPSDGTPGGNTPGTPGGETPGTPGGNRPGTPGGNTPGTPGGNTPGTPGGNTPGTPGGNTPGTPGGNTPGTPGGNTPGTPGGKTPVTPGGNTPGTPGGKTPVTPGGKTPGIPGGETPITPGGNTPGTFDDGNVEYPKNSNELEKNNSLVELERNKPSGQLSKQGGVDKSISQSGNSLPQTGEERNLLLLFAGIVFIVVGALLISFRRKTKAL